MRYKVFAEDLDGVRRHLADCEGDNNGTGIHDLYADECNDDEEIVIVECSTKHNDKALRAAVEAVEENNEVNVGGWADWESVKQIEETYQIEGLTDADRKILGDAIESNGRSLNADLAAVELEVFGQNFAGSWWYRL